MLVVDTSAFISLAVGHVFDPVCDTFDVVATQTVLNELEQTSTYDDRDGRAARTVIDARDRFAIVAANGDPFVTSRIDAGEGSCVAAVRDLNAAFLITDDFRALPELQTLVDADVALSPIVLRALVTRRVLTEEEAVEAFERIAADRDWLGAPIYRYARRLFD